MNTESHSQITAPYLSPFLSTLQCICLSVQQAQAQQSIFQLQLQALTQCIAELLESVNGECLAGRLSKDKITGRLASFASLLEDISIFIQHEAASDLLKSLLAKDQRTAKIDRYQKRIVGAAKSFQVPALLSSTEEWQQRVKHARTADQQLLDHRLATLEGNLHKLAELINVHSDNTMTAFVTLKRRLGADDSDMLNAGPEHQFLLNCFYYLSTSKDIVGMEVKIEDWTVTSYEVEFGREIGAGGFGRVFSGEWNKTQIALKVFKTDGGITPSPAAIRKEIKTWSRIKHPNILQFFGANILDDTPFIVMPYLKNGNIRDYLRNHPDSDRLKLLHGISLGIVYLHSQQIVHGDLKALNVLIDDSGKSVLCDFGLSRVKANTTSRSTQSEGVGIEGSANWMAPERLLGGLLKKPCDIYAFAMTLYEIYVNEIPLGGLNYVQFIELVVRQDLRPKRPRDKDAPYLSDFIWRLAEKCWVKDPRQRPTAVVLCDTISQFVGNPDVYLQSRFVPPVSVPSPRTPHVGQPGANVQLPPVAQVSVPTSRTVVINLASSPPLNFRLIPSLTMRGHTKFICSVAFSPCGTRIVSGAADNTIRVWDATSGKCVLGPLEGHTQWVSSVLFSPNGRLIASSSADMRIRVWDAHTGKTDTPPMRGRNAAVRSIAFSPNSKRIASGLSDGGVYVWNRITGQKVVGPLNWHKNGVPAIAFSADGKKVVSGSHDKTIMVFNAETGEAIAGPLTGHNADISFVAFSMDGSQIFSGPHKMNLRVWDATTGDFVSEYSKLYVKIPPAVHFTSSAKNVTISSDGRWLAEIDGANLCVSDTDTQRLQAAFRGHTEPIWCVAFSPDGKRVVSGSVDCTIQVCNLDY